MSFMQREVFKGRYFEVETDNAGTCIVPTDVCGTNPDIKTLQMYCEGTITIDEDIPENEQIPEIKTGWLARMTAPGYLDCTTTTPYGRRWMRIMNRLRTLMWAQIDTQRNTLARAAGKQSSRRFTGETYGDETEEE